MAGKCFFRMRARDITRAAAIAAVVVTMALPASADEEQTINAFAVWHGRGHVVQTAENKAVIAGAFGGVLFVETSEGPVDTGNIACPGLINVDLETGQQRGVGACTFTAYDGARAFGEWECTGVALVGCRGRFKLTGGTGRLAGAGGSGNVLFRARFHEFAKHPGELISDSAVGIAVWRDLKIAIKQPADTPKR